MILNGKPIFFIKELLLNPSISIPFILYPACGTFSISIFPFAPTNNISISGAFLFNALAIAMAGKICPPVPPPAISHGAPRPVSNGGKFAVYICYLLTIVSYILSFTHLSVFFIFNRDWLYRCFQLFHISCHT